jgi:hypothetical protein
MGWRTSVCRSLAQGDVMALQSKLIRKSLVVAAAIAMPLSVTAVTGGTSAAATGPADPPVTCSVGSTLTFAPPGISKAGSVTAAKKSFSTISAATLGGCSGSGPAMTIQFPNLHCVGPGQPPSNPACQTVYSGTLDGYDSWANFESSRMTTAVQKSLKSLSFTINGISYVTKGTVASQILAGGLCGGSEVGFHVVGIVKSPKPDKGQTMTLNLCLGTITGNGLTSSTFSGAASDQNGTVATTAVDPATSTVHVG